MKEKDLMKYPLTFTLDFKLDIVKGFGEFMPILSDVQVMISGPKESKKAADYLHDNLSIYIPYIIARYLIELGIHTPHAEPGIIAACEMVKDVITGEKGDHE